MDTLSGQLERKMSFQPGERDLVMLQHKFVVEWKDGKTVRRASPYLPSDFAKRLVDSMLIMLLKRRIHSHLRSSY